MTTTLQHFGLSQDQIIRKDGNFYLTISKLSSILDIDPSNIRRNINRNKNEFGKIAQDKLSTPSGEQEHYLLDEEQIYILCMITRSSEKAKEFRRVFAKALKMIRSKEFVHISEVNGLKRELGETQQKLIGRQQKIGRKRLTRFYQLRSKELTQVEAANALKIPHRTARRLDKAQHLINTSTFQLTGGEHDNQN